MKQVPCMVEGNHCLINGLLTIDQKGWGHSVTAIGKDKKGRGEDEKTETG